MKLHEFWELNPKQFQKYVDGYRNRLKTQLELIDVANHMLGQYIAYAVNEPKKYPRKPLTQTNLSKKEMSPEEMEAFAKRYTEQYKNVKIK